MLSDVRTVLSEFSTVVAVFSTVVVVFALTLLKRDSLQTKRRNTFDSITSSTPLLVVCFC